MNDPKRKKSSSSDSELSDGWSLVEHLDTVPLSPRSPDMTPQLHSAIPQQHPVQEVQTLAVRHLPMSPSDETSSDAESVEIIQEDARLGDFVYPRGIARITPLTAGEVDKEEYEREKDPAEVKEVMLNESGSEYSIGVSFFSNEWIRLFTLFSSLVTLLLLLVTYTSLFVKEQACSKSDGLIVLPDEDLSSLIADLALFKEENIRLKGELNMIKYEYGNDKKMNIKPEEPLEITATEDIIGLEVISDNSPISGEPINFKPLTISIDSEKPKTSDNLKESINLQQKRVENLAQLEDNLKTFANNVGLKNIVVSSYNIAHNLDSINSIVKNLNTVIDKETSLKKENKKFQLKQKLVKLHDKIEQDFKKSVEKVAKRVGKFHDEFLSAFCRIKGGVSDVDNIDCSKFYHVKKDMYQKSKEHKDEFKKKSKNFVKSKNFNSENQDLNVGNSVPNAEETTNPDKINQATENDFIMRLKRSLDIKKVPSAFNIKRDKKNNNENTNYEHKHMKQDKYPENHRKTYKQSYHSKQHFESEENIDEDNLNESHYFDGTKNIHNSNIRHKEDKNKEKHHKNKDYSGEVKTEDWKKGKKIKYEEETVKSEDNFLKNNEQSKVDLNSSEEITSKYEEKKEKKDKFDENRSSKKNCDTKFEKKIYKNSQKFVKSEQEYGKFGNDGKNPSGPSTIHNESIYSKIVNGNGKRKIEPNGEWYLDLGEVRNQKRLRRAVRDRSGWIFDRALVRDWCRTNSGSSLCTSFGQFCDYCV